jgi:hypothetical protein
MKPEAVQQAYERLQRAKTAAALLADPDRPFGQLSIDWSNFILAVNTIYTKLEQGSKGNKKSEAWFGVQKHKRRKDALLRYLHAARNSDEHSLELTAGVGLSGKSLHEGVLVNIDQTRRNVRIDYKDGAQPALGADVAQITVGFYPEPVTDTRFNERFDLPKSHLCQPIADQTARGLAILAIGYFEKMVAEAATLLPT